MASQEPDFLEEDAEIPSQRFVLLSFLSPEKVLERKDLFFFERFLKNYEVEWKTKNLEDFLASTANNYNKRLGDEADKLFNAGLKEQGDLVLESRIQVADMITEYKKFVQKNAADINKTKIKEDYENFMYKNREKIEDEYYAANQFQTTVRGLKVRGSYPTKEEAAARAKKLQKSDTVHNIYVADVGKWLPWDPSPSQIKDHEYANDELNKLMKSYRENEASREDFYTRNPHLRANGDMTASKENTTSSTVGGDMFDTVGDLALQRKIENKKKGDEY
jgi:hypothetical protein